MTEPLWVRVARAFEGIEEVPGGKSNPVIMRWARDIGAPKFYDNDDVPWCAVWMNRIALVMGWPLSDSGDKYDLLRAASFKTWGQAMRIPAVGAVMVFARPGGGHVGLYLGERPDAYYVLGGNTSNSVRAAWIPKDRLIAQRWPPGEQLPQDGRVLLADNGEPVSRNEA